MCIVAATLQNNIFVAEERYATIGKANVLKYFVN